jgi:hypothetical protein
MKNTKIFIMPSKVNNLGNYVVLELLYIANHLFGELILANVGGRQNRYSAATSFTGRGSSSFNRLKAESR